MQVLGDARADASRPGPPTGSPPRPAHPTGSPRPARPRRRWLPDALGLAWVLVAGVAMLVPALIHGSHLGPFDLLTKSGLTRQTGVVIHNTYPGDQISAIMPWTVQAWTQVHHGHLPLWNPLNGVGMPLAFNWQSAPFSVPALVGYLVPVQYAYTVGIIVTVLIAGTGAYLLGRVLRLGVVGCVMAATTFELSGPFVGWLGWPHATVFAWTGWLFAAALLIVRGRRRALAVAFFAALLAAAVYSGQPEILAEVVLALAVFLAVVLIRKAWSGGVRSIGRPVLDLALASVAGAALAAPLALPGSQLASASVHSSAGSIPGLPLHGLVYLAFQGFDGLPLAGSATFGPFGGFYTAGYVGVIALVLAGVAVVARRRIEVLALAAVVLVGGIISFAAVTSLTTSVVRRLPVLGTIPARSLLVVAFALAILAGVGVDALVREGGARLWWGAGAGFALLGVIIVVLVATTTRGLTPVERTLRLHSFVWPTVGVMVGLGVAGAMILWLRWYPSGSTPGAGRPAGGGGAWLRPATWAGVVLLFFESVFLVTAGAPLWSSSPSFFPPNPAESSLQRAVGSSLVAVGSSNRICIGLGIRPNVNIVFGVHELALYDPIVPTSYFTSFTALTGKPAGTPVFNSYCPPIDSASLARVYGVSYVLVRAGAPAPTGTSLVRQIGDEDLYHVPASYPATVTPLEPGGAEPGVYAPGRPVAVSHPGPSSWSMTTRSASPQLLRLRLADITGWHASIDGKPLALEPYAGIMLQARVPAGVHAIELHYWPETFTVGLGLAAGALIGLAAAVVVGERRRAGRGAGRDRDPATASAPEGVS